MIFNKKITVELTCAFLEPQYLAIVELDAGTTLYQALVASGIFVRTDADCPRELLRFGIYGELVHNPQTHPLAEGDRVEIYRPLSLHPKTRRLQVMK